MRVALLSRRTGGVPRPLRANSGMPRFRGISARVVLCVLCLALVACASEEEDDDDEEVHARIEELLVGCGEVCDTDIQGHCAPALSPWRARIAPMALLQIHGTSRETSAQLSHPMYSHFRSGFLFGVRSGASVVGVLMSLTIGYHYGDKGSWCVCSEIDVDTLSYDSVCPIETFSRYLILARTPVSERGWFTLQAYHIGALMPHSLDPRSSFNTRIPLAGVESLFFPRTTKEVDCVGLWSNAAIDKSRPPGPAPEIPRGMREHFSYGGRVSLGRWV
jgi:hypothetical protein